MQIKERVKALIKLNSTVRKIDFGVGLGFFIGSIVSRSGMCGIFLFCHIVFRGENPLDWLSWRTIKLLSAGAGEGRDR